MLGFCMENRDVSREIQGREICYEQVLGTGEGGGRGRHLWLGGRCYGNGNKQDGRRAKNKIAAC
jgi:hypothetical protein